MKKVILFSVLFFNASSVVIGNRDEMPFPKFSMQCNHGPIGSWDYCAQCNPFPHTPPASVCAAPAPSKQNAPGIIPYVPYVGSAMVLDQMFLRPYGDYIKKELTEAPWDSALKIEFKIVRLIRSTFYVFVAYQTGKTVQAYLQKKFN